MIQAVPLLCCVLLSPVAAFPRNAQNGVLTSPPSVTENGPQPSTLPRQNPLPDPRACQDLLHTVPSLAPLPEHLSKIALRVALEEAGCLAEAHNLQLHLSRMGAKDITETLIRQSQERREEGWVVVQWVKPPLVSPASHIGVLALRAMPQCWFPERWFKF